MHNKMILALGTAFAEPKKMIEYDEKTKNDKVFQYVTHLTEYERKYLGISTNKATGKEIDHEAIKSFSCKNIPDLKYLSQSFTKDEKTYLGFTNKEIELIDYEFNNSK